MNLKRHLVCLGTILVSTGAAHAGAFSMEGASPSALGNAFAGSATGSHDNSDTFFNPATLRATQTTQIHLGLTSVDTTIDATAYSSTFSDNIPRTGQTQASGGRTVSAPSLYFSTPINASWTFGASVTSPLKWRTTYPEGWLGRFHALDTDIDTLNATAQLAYQINDTLAVGAGLQYEQMAATVSRNTSPTAYGVYRGKDHQHGFTLGVLAQPTPELKLGLGYRSAMRYSLRGDVNLTSLTTGAITTVPGQVDWTMPDMLTLGAAYQANEKTQWVGDIRWTRWSSVSVFRIQFKAGGTGLGLAYCQRTMQAFGGDIVCNSVLGSYTEFTLLFPPISEAEIQLEEHKVMSQAVPFFDGKRVLVVDDQPFVRQSTCRALEGIATRVDEAEDGAQAITKLRLGIYDLVVMDLDMPVLDGYAAAEQIRQGAAPGHEEVAIVAYTAESAYVAQVKTEKVGMNGFVSKPCSQTELLRTLQAGMQAAAEATRLKGAARRLVGKRVLVADDCAFNRKITVAYLRTMGIQSVEAQNGQEALDLACMDERFDAALLDMEMPVMNGVQTARALRSAETGGRRLPLIALTAHLCDTHMTQALEAGMDGFVSKPFSDAHLRTTLLKVLPPERAASGANGPSKS